MASYSAYPFGDFHWKSPVDTAAHLPSSGNSLGDARIAEDTETIYIWSGSAWVPVSGGGGGSGTVTSIGISSSTLNVTGSPVTTSGVINVEATGATNTFAGFDSLGNLFTIPNWNIDTTYTPSRFGVNASFQIDPFLTAGYNVTNNISSQLVPSADAPNDSEVLLQLNTQLDPTNTGFGLGAPTGLAARILDLNLNAATSGANGQVQVLNIDANVGDPVITGGSIDSLIPININLQQQQGFSLSQMGAVQATLHSDVGSSVQNANVYTADLQINGSLANFVSFYQAFGNITNTNSSTANVNVFSSAIQINGHLGDVSIYTDFNTIPASANITAEYNSINLNPSSSTGAVIRSYTGFNLSPNFSAAPITDDISGIKISLQNITAGTNLTGLDINVNGSTDSNAQGVTGFSCNGRLGINVETQLVSGQGFQIGNRIESLLHVHPGSPVTGTDSLGNDFAGDLLAEDNIANGPIGLGWSSVGFVADMAVATGKTVATVNVFLPAVALPDPGFPTGGHVNDMSFIRMFTPLSQGGTITVDNLYSVKLDPVFGNLTSVATNAWGIWIGDTTADNWFAKNVVIGGSTGKPETGQALDVTGAVRLRTLGAGIVMSDANGHLSSAASAFLANTDGLYSLANTTDSTKIQKFDLSGQSTGTTLTISPLNTSNMVLNVPQVATASGAGMALVQDETTGFIFSYGITSSIGSANSMMQLANATTANRAQIKLHSYFNGASVAGVSTLTSRSGTIAVNAAVVAGQDYSKWTAQAAATTPGSAPISGTWSFKANTVNSLTVTSDFHLQLANLAGTLTDALYLTSEGHLLLGTSTDATNARLLLKNGHLVSQQTTSPTAAVQAGAGTGATSTVSQSTDTAGIINITTGTVTLASGAQSIVTFNSAYNVAPIVVITPNNSVTALAAVGAYVTSNTTTMTINFGAAGVLNTAYSWNYYVIETQ